MNSIQSAPNLPVSSPAHPRLKDVRLPVKSLRAREDTRKEIIEFKGRPKCFDQEVNDKEPKVRPKSMFHDSESILEFSDQLRKKTEGTILEIKGRPSDQTSVPVLDFTKSRVAMKETANILEIKRRPGRRSGVRLKFSSTESMATSSSGGSLESIRSSTSEGNRSTTSSESPHSSSLSSHSSDSGGSCGITTINLHHMYHHHQSSGNSGGMTGSRFFSHQSNKLHILSPISDKSSLEPASETSDNNKNNNSQKASPEDLELPVQSPTAASKAADPSWTETGSKVKRRTPQNKNIINLSLQQSSSSGEAEVHGSDSGISLDSRGTTKNNKGYSGTGFTFLKLGGLNIENSIDTKTNPPTDLTDLPFDMPKLRRRRLQNMDTCTSGSATSVDLNDLPFDMPKLRRRLQQDTCTSGSATSVDLHELPFDMPKLRRRLRGGQPQLMTEEQTSTESSGVSQASSSQSVRDAERIQAIGAVNRPSLTLNLEGGSPLRQRSMGLCLNLGGAHEDATIDADLPLERQGWFHGTITRLEAETILRLMKEGSYLVRNSESTRQDYSLSLKSARGFMHMRIQLNKETGKFILGQFSKPFDNIPEMIRHYCLNRLPIRGAEHMCLLHAVIEQLL